MRKQEQLSGVNTTVLQEENENSEQNRDQKIQKLGSIPKLLSDFVKEYRTYIIVVLAWIFISELAGYGILDLLLSLYRLITYPLYMILFQTEFGDTDIPEPFLLLIPLVVIYVVGFFLIISTEE